MNNKTTGILDGMRYPRAVLDAAVEGIGQEIHDQDCTIIDWTTDVCVAQVICEMLTDNEGLLIPRSNERNDNEAICC